jgi:hypothetical protein
MKGRKLSESKKKAIAKALMEGSCVNMQEIANELNTSSFSVRKVKLELKENK